MLDQRIVRFYLTESLSRYNTEIKIMADHILRIELIYKFYYKELEG
ncbi:lytic amidase [Salmonella phage 41]|nr:lytic amidase [Salmonella phage 41]